MGSRSAWLLSIALLGVPVPSPAAVEPKTGADIGKLIGPPSGNPMGSLYFFEFIEGPSAALLFERAFPVTRRHTCLFHSRDRRVAGADPTLTAHHANDPVALEPLPRGSVTLRAFRAQFRNPRRAWALLDRRILVIALFSI